MDPAQIVDDVLAGPEVEVVRVSENDLGAERSHLVGVERLDSCLRADRHERRSADRSVRRFENPSAGLTLDGFDSEAQKSGPRRCSRDRSPRGHPAPPPTLSLLRKCWRMGHEIVPKA